jgi:hypothetical protein
MTAGKDVAASVAARKELAAIITRSRELGSWESNSMRVSRSLKSK